MTTPPLCLADDATFWPWLSWTDFAALPQRERMLVVLPVAGFADWGLGHPLDVEETILMSVLRVALQLRPTDLRPLVLPPLRFVLGHGALSAFAVDPDLAHAQIREVADSVAAAGFRRLVLYNASPYNEELCDAAARDLRIQRGLETFCLNLSGLGLDFDPERGGDRAPLRAVLEALSGNQESKRAKTLFPAASHLVALLQEIQGRPPLPRSGAIVNLEAPK